MSPTFRNRDERGMTISLGVITNIAREEGFHWVARLRLGQFCQIGYMVDIRERRSRTTLKERRGPWENSCNHDHNYCQHYTATNTNASYTISSTTITADTDAAHGRFFFAGSTSSTILYFTWDLLMMLFAVAFPFGHRPAPTHASILLPESNNMLLCCWQ
jgi:hypothetical protein